MSGPADYLRVTGPLGGANFLSVDDYNKIDPLSPARSTMALMQQGANLSGTMANTKAQQLNNQQVQDQRVAAQKAEQVRQEAIKYGLTQLPSYQAPQQAAPQAAPTPVAQQAAPMAPAAMAPTGASAYPGAQTAGAVTPLQQAAAQAAATGAPMPAGVEQSAPAPEAQPAPAPTQAPPTAAIPEQAKPIMGRVAGLLQQVQARTGAFEQDRAKIMEDVQAGKISPAVADVVLKGIAGNRDADIGRATAFEEKLAEIGKKWADSDKTEADIKKTRIEVAKATREFEDDAHFEVLALANGSSDLAKAQAAKLGLDPSTLFKEDGTPTASLVQRAERSPTGKAAREEARKVKKETSEERRADAKEERERLGVGTGKDVPAGVREVVVDGQVAYVDADGRKLSAAQVQKMSLAKATAGATRVGGGSASDRRAAEKETKAVRQTDLSTRGAFDNSIAALDSVNRVLDTGQVEKASGIQNFLGLTKLPGGPWRQAQQDIVNVFNNAVLDYKMAMATAGGSVRMFDANKEAEALEKAVANLDWNAGDKFVRQQIKGIADRMNRGIVQLNRAREAEGLSPLSAQSAAGAAPSGGAVKMTSPKGTVVDVPAGEVAAAAAAGFKKVGK